MKTSFNKCILVWVDDNFIKNDYLNKNEEIDKWNEIFGGISKKIYRLLDLELKIITTKSDFDEYLQSIENVLDTYYYFILDLSVPKTIHDEPKVINGLNMGVSLKEKKYDFCYLSSNSSAGNEMQENGLGSVDYYIKFNDDVLLPESLSHKILVSFRNNISWIDLNILLSSIDEESNLFNTRDRNSDLDIGLSIFPYFDKFKDFIDRSELESYNFNNSMFIRSHAYNSQEFEMQSILIMMTNIIFLNPGNIIINYGKFSEEAFRSTVIKDTKNSFWFVKMNTKDCMKEFKDFYSHVMHKRVFFIIENNEDAERFLESVDSVHTTIKDLPYINETDSILRHTLTQKTLSLLLHLKHTTDNGIKFHDLYLDYPELLLNPVNLNFMENPKFITRDMSDIPEIIEAFKNSLDDITVSISNTLRSGNSFENPDDFLKIAQDLLVEESHKVALIKILISTLDRWLKDSWLFPYGIQIDNYHNKELTDKWKKSSFEILRMLVRQLVEYKHIVIHLQERRVLIQSNLVSQSDNERVSEINKIYDIADDDIDMEYLDTYNNIELVLNVLNSDVMHNIIENDAKDISAETWEELSYLKWPHTTYPMPWYLNHILSRSNKHLWIQHENFNFVGYSEKLINEHRKLNSMLEYYDDSLDFIDKTYKHFPLKMQRFIEQLVIGIKQKNIVNDAVFIENFKNFANTTLNISSLFGACINKSKANDIVKIKKNLDDLGSFGTKLEYIRDTQFKNKYLFKIQDIKGYDHKKYLSNLRKNIFYLYNKTNYRNNSPFLESMYQQFAVKNFTVSVESLEAKELKVYKNIVLAEDGRFQIDLSSLENATYNLIKKIGTRVYSPQLFTKSTSSAIFEDRIYLQEISTIAELVNKLAEDKKLNTKLTFAKETSKIMSDQELYDLSVLKSVNKTPLQQVQNIINNIGQLDMYFNILKYIDGIELYEFMTDTRNKAVEHQKLKINLDYMFESFIYSYETIWLQYQYLVKHFDPENETTKIEANYIAFDSRLSIYEDSNFSLNKMLSIDIKSKDELDTYLNTLVEEKQS